MTDVLIIGASGGIGGALFEAYQTLGHNVTGLSRSRDDLDLTDPAKVEDQLGDLGPFDRVIVATGALEIDGTEPEKSFRRLEAKAMQDQFALNAIGPALVLRHAHRLLPRNRQCVFVALSARVGSIGDNRLGGWVSYRAAKAALNQIVRTASIEMTRTHPHSAIVALHPGTVATSFTEKYVGRHPATPVEEAARRLIDVIESLSPGDTGRFMDYAGKEIPW